MNWCESKAVVLLSGGQDSTFSLFWAKEKFAHVEALFFIYGQRHLAQEREASGAVAAIAQVPLTEATLDLKGIGRSALLSEEEPNGPHPLFPNLPASFVPLRNLILLSLAGCYAVSRGIPNLVTGVSQQDYSGYPDCREEFIHSFALTANKALGLENRMRVWTPVLKLSKAEEVRLAQRLPQLMKAWAYSHTCYKGMFPPCGECNACLLRAKAFEEAGVEDPLLERARNERLQTE